MESFRGDKLGFYAFIYKSKSSETWIRGKDFFLSLGSKDNKKKLLFQDTRYICYFLNKDGVNELITVEKQLKSVC